MAEKMMAKYTSDTDEHYMGVPAKDLYESDWNALSDENKALVNESSFYTVRGEGVKDAEAAAKRVERAPEPVPPMVEQAVAAIPEPPAPKEDAKK